MNKNLQEQLLKLKQVMDQIKAGKMHGLNWYRILEPTLDELMVEIEKLAKT